MTRDASMSESAESVSSVATGLAAGSTLPSPGMLLRGLREGRGMSVGVLAAMLKVSPRKLESLEADRFDELPDATFVKALALAVCRALKADPSAVMAAYAARDLAADPFKAAGRGIDAPMRSSVRGRVIPMDRSRKLFAARWWLVAALLLALVLAGVWWMTGAVGGPGPASSSTSPGVDAQVVASSSPVTASAAETGVALAPSSEQAPGMSVPEAAAVTAPVESAAPEEASLSVMTTADSWVEVVDASRRVVWSQVVPEGESIELSAVPPLQVVVGNARATRLQVDGQPVNLTAHVRGNVARLQIP